MAIIKSIEKDIDLVNSLLAAKNDKYEVWKYFEDRADKLSERLWRNGVWLVTILSSIISLPFVAGFVKLKSPGFPLLLKNPVAVAFISIVGIVFCFYYYFALFDVREHIEGNWRRSAYALKGKWEETALGGRKRSGWNTLMVVGGCGLLAFFALLLFALFTLLPNRFKG